MTFIYDALIRMLELMGERREEDFNEFKKLGQAIIDEAAKITSSTGECSPTPLDTPELRARWRDGKNDAERIMLWVIENGYCQ